jgi:hypothetical protein
MEGDVWIISLTPKEPNLHGGKRFLDFPKEPNLHEKKKMSGFLSHSART